MKPVKLITNLLFTALFAIVLASLLNIPFAASFTGLLLVGCIVRNPEGVLNMALQKEIWQQDIVDNLFKDNGWANQAVYNADQFVLAGKVVHTPLAGTPATIKKNLDTFPQTAVKRTDNEQTYVLDTFYALPHFVENIEKYELSYDKRQSVVGEDEKALIQAAMDSLLYRWAPAAASVVETTGADSAADLIDGTATGTRKLFTKTEFKTIAKKLAVGNLSGGRMIALLTATHYYQFFESLSDAEKTDVGRVADLATGKVGKYMGVEIFMRSAVLRYRKVAAVWTVVDEQADAFAAGTDDSAASLFWAENCVERAKGDVMVFDDTANPLYYGDVFSAEMRLGGRQRRSAGVYAVVEAL